MTTAGVAIFGSMYRIFQMKYLDLKGTYRYEEGSMGPVLVEPVNHQHGSGCDIDRDHIANDLGAGRFEISK